MKQLRLPKERFFIGPALIWKRIAAFFIDLLILALVVFFPFRKLLQSTLPKNYSFAEMYDFLSKSSAYNSYILSVYLTMSVFVFLYFYIMERKMSQTIGKKIMNVYIVSDNDNLNRWQLLVRNLVFIPIFPFDLLFIIDPAFMLFTKTNQRLTEILSRTKVVERFIY